MFRLCKETLPMCCTPCLHRGLKPTHPPVDVSYHGERHAVDLVFVFGLVLSEGTVPEKERQTEVRVTETTSRF